MIEEMRSPTQTLEISFTRHVLADVDALARLCNISRELFIAQVVDAHIATHRLSNLHGPEGTHYNKRNPLSIV